jgi:uncharacterized membrane protein
VIAQQSVEISQERWSGPLPHPGDLERYEQIVPGSAAKIIEAFSLQGEHRRKQEDRLVRGSELRGYIGQWMGFVVALAFLAVAYLLIRKDHDIAGTFIGTLDLAALVAVFVLGRRLEQSD